MRKSFVSALLALSLISSVLAEPPKADKSFSKALELTAGMVGDPEAREMANKLGLNFVNVTWEDTGRYKGSSVGPNISDMSLLVQSRDKDSDKLKLTLLPVLRHPNFSDKTADLPLDKFYLLVGNEDGQPLHKVNLRQYLSNPKKYMSFPESWTLSGDATLLAQRDTHALVSAQACFLPVPKAGKVEFNPVLFNYQSGKKNPAVLTILATREGTSMTIIDNARDPFEAGASWGQRLYFNQKGQRASLTGERLSDFQAKETEASPPSITVGQQEGLNMVMLIQVPLVYKEPSLRYKYYSAPSGLIEGAPARSAVNDLETAVIGHGDLEGPFTEVDGLPIKRDERFPVRVTVQFYQATSTGKVSDGQLQEIKSQLDRVYADGDYVGSLVVAGETGRPTEYDGPKEEPDNWWEIFWSTHRRELEEQGWQF